uniref:Uncharacterized protein n=1 Tax=Romanomermis culicivorax TaxID=13658 RepID=A0A915J7I8_ROMCU
MIKTEGCHSGCKEHLKRYPELKVKAKEAKKLPPIMQGKVQKIGNCSRGQFQFHNTSWCGRGAALHVQGKGGQQGQCIWRPCGGRGRGHRRVQGGGGLQQFNVVEVTLERWQRLHRQTCNQKESSPKYNIPRLDIIDLSKA